MGAKQKACAGFTIALACAFAAFSFGSPSAADPPGRVNFQGMARDGGGTVLDGPVAMVFRFYDDPAAGTILWEETYDAIVHPPAVTVSAGLFTIALGDPEHRSAGSEASLQDVFANHGAVYLGVNVGDDVEMTPRISVASAPFAVNSGKLEGKEADDFAGAIHTHAATDVTSGTLVVARGGTGLTAPGTSGNVLTSTGSAWTSSAPPTAATTGAVVDAADTTLTRSGSGTGGNPYKLALNLASANTWTGPQTFQRSVYVYSDDPRLNMESSASEWGPIIDLGNDSPVQTNLGSILFRKTNQPASGEITCKGTGDMTFRAGGQQRMVIDSAGHVGIGTTEPEYNLDVAAQLPKVRFKASGSLAPELWFESGPTSPSLLGQIFFKGPTQFGGISYFASDKMHFITNNSSRMVIDAEGDIGIGTTYPAYKLDVLGDANFGSSATSNTLCMKGKEAIWFDGNYFSWGYEGSANYFRRNIGIGTTSPAFPLTFAPETGDKISLYTSSPTEIYGFGVGSSLLQVFSSKSSTDIAFGYGSSANFTERMRIKGNGNVGIGTNAPTYQLQLSANSAAKPGTNTWTVASDLRLKKDVAPFTDGLEVLGKIRPISYRYNGLAGLPRDLPCIGVSAQEIKEVAPYTVGTFKARLTERDETETELYDFNSHALTFVIINAIKELDERTKGLAPQSEVADLSGKESSGQKGTAKATAVGRAAVEASRPLSFGSAPDASGTEVAAVPPPERFPVCETVEAGDVLVADAAHPGVFCLSRQGADPKVVGLATGEALSTADERGEGTTYPLAPLATSGIATCKVDAAYGPISVGDLLATSPTPGHAQKAVDPKPGTVLGKALEALDAGAGTIRVLVMLR